MKKSYFIILAVLAIIAAIGFSALNPRFFASAVSAQQTPTIVLTTNTNVLITSDMLTKAGFTNITVQSPQGEAYQLPNYYFHVNEAVIGPLAKSMGSAVNLVAVLVVPKPDKSWQYNGGQMQTLDMGGRPQIRFSTANNYIVVTGPDSQRVQALANELQSLY